MLESLHCRAGKIIFNMPRDKPHVALLEEAWCAKTLTTLVYKIYNVATPPCIRNIINRQVTIKKI